MCVSVYFFSRLAWRGQPLAQLGRLQSVFQGPRRVRRDRPIVSFILVGICNYTEHICNWLREWVNEKGGGLKFFTPWSSTPSWNYSRYMYIYLLLFVVFLFFFLHPGAYMDWYVYGHTRVRARGDDYVLRTCPEYQEDPRRTHDGYEKKKKKKNKSAPLALRGNYFLTSNNASSIAKSKSLWYSSNDCNIKLSFSFFNFAWKIKKNNTKDRSGRASRTREPREFRW